MLLYIVLVFLFVIIIYALGYRYNLQDTPRKANRIILGAYFACYLVYLIWQFSTLTHMQGVVIFFITFDLIMGLVIIPILAVLTIKLLRTRKHFISIPILAGLVWVVVLVTIIFGKMVNTHQPLAASETPASIAIHSADSLPMGNQPIATPVNSPH